MKTKLGVLICFVAATLAQASTLRSSSATEDGQTNNLTTLLQQGLLEEQANRNLDAAIADYQSLATQFDKDRKLAATAIFRLGECYRIQGKTNEAVAQYQRILREFPDEKTLAALSRQNLALLGVASSTTTSSDNSGAQLWNRVKNLPQDQLEEVLPRLAPDPVLTSLLQQRNEAETKLAEMQNQYGPHNPDLLNQKAALAAINKQISEKIQGIMAALKLRAELAQTMVPATAPTDAEDQEIQRIQRMIQNSPDLINRPGKEGTPLQKAAWHGWLRVATFLLNHGADVNAQDSVGSSASQFGTTALGTATLAGNRAMVELLLRHGADINAQGAGLKTPLEIAAEKGFPAVVEVLLANNADVNAVPWAGPALLLSVQKGRTKIAQMLLAAGANPNLGNNDGDTPLSAAVQPSLVPQEIRVEIVKLLLGAGANPNVTNHDGRTPLSYAADGNWNKRPEIVKLLLNAKANPNGGKLDAPLFCAIHNRDVESAELLLQAGANPNAKGRVSWQVVFNDVAYNSGNGSETPLWLAVSMQQLPMVKLLLKFKAEANDTQTDGHSLLFDALSETNILKVLLDAGADPNMRIQQGGSPFLPVGRSPLEDALFDGKSDSVALLLAHGAQVNSVDKGEGMTPLLWAANRGASTNIIELLLHAGANVNAKDHQGNTPLHDAAENGYGQIVALLLAHKADPNVRSNFGRTPLDIVRAQIANRRNRPIFSVIRQSGMANSQASRTPPQEIEKMLLAHGALEHLPHWNRIEVSRPWSHFSATVFQEIANDWNHFTLLEAILNFYRKPAFGGQTSVFASRLAQLEKAPPGSFEGPNGALPFPDLSRVVILRPSHDSTNVTRLTVNLLNGTNGIDCAKDVPLKFGDVVEIHERNHPLGEQPVGLTVDQHNTIENYLKGNVQLVTGNQKVTIPIFPVPTDSLLGSVLSTPTAQGILMSSADLAHVKVIRCGPKTGKTKEWILDCSNLNANASAPEKGCPDLWLRNGDVIEVPEKP